MKLKAFCIYDSKVQHYEPPFFRRSTGEAVRGFVDLVNDEKTTIYMHPEDYVLFELGAYDPETGSYENLSAPHSLGVGKEFVKTKPTLN